LAATFKLNEEQQDGINNVELWTEWTEATWNTSEVTVRRGRNMSIKAQLVTNDDGGGGGGDEFVGRFPIT
jgi:hypothetical protein